LKEHDPARWVVASLPAPSPREEEGLRDAS
jgi:hypothetical protein